MYRQTYSDYRILKCLDCWHC